MEKHPYRVRVRRWAEIIEENRQRLFFYRQHLDYQAEDDRSVDDTLAKYISRPHTQREDKANRESQVVE